MESWQTSLTASSITSTLKHESSKDGGYFMALDMSNITSLSCILRINHLSAISIRALVVAKNGHPRMTSTSKSSSISIITKSTGNMNLSTLTNTSSMMPLGYLTDLSASWTDILVGLGSPRFRVLNSEYGIRFMLTP